mmetsp:Transcript_15409/g.31363  ORF Transcript_15409/g.31363 Transcript_15409/m.31363 type:complete len:852 (+) Transcript_15409:452-3007(+)
MQQIEDVIETKRLAGERGDDENTETSTPMKKKRKKKSKDEQSSPTSKAVSSKGGTPKKSKKDVQDMDEDDDDEDDATGAYWTACYAVSFNRRGSFLASGHASGLVACHDFMSRTASALYSPPQGNFAIEKEKNGDGHASCRDGPSEVDKKTDVKNNSNVTDEKKKENLDLSTQVQQQDSQTFQEIKSEPKDGKSLSKSSDKVILPQLEYLNGVTSISWDHHSRTLLAGAIGDYNLRLMDNTHPQVCLDCTESVRRQWISTRGLTASTGGDDDNLRTPDGKNSRDDQSMLSPPIFTSFSSPQIQKQKTKEMDTSTPEMREKHKQEQLARGACKESGLSVDGSGEPIQLRLETVSFGKARLIRANTIARTKSTKTINSNDVIMQKTSIVGMATSDMDQSTKIFIDSPREPHFADQVSVPAVRHSTLIFELPQPLGGPTQLHPRDNHAGLVCMIDGSLALFRISPLAFYETIPSMISRSNDKNGGKRKGKTAGKRKDHVPESAKNINITVVRELLEKEEANREGNVVYLIPPPKGKRLSLDSRDSPKRHDYFVTCAAFGKNGDVLYAVTKCGSLLGYQIDSSVMKVLRGETSAQAIAKSCTRPSLCVKVPGGAAAWQIIVSRNGRHLLINSADCALRLYDVDELNNAFTSSPVPMKELQPAPVKPRFVFQDIVSKAPWASCDFSGDGEYVVGGCNSYPQPGDNYQLFLWNTVTGDLLDQLTGPQVPLYSLSCHPTRPFIAVGTLDGLIDVWGPRLDWTAFAPDFQALQQNVLYLEREDEFDIVIDGEEGERNKRNSMQNTHASDEDEDVDITTVAKIAAFDSDSENEDEVFCFDCRVMKMGVSDKAGSKKADQE